MAPTIVNKLQSFAWPGCQVKIHFASQNLKVYGKRFHVSYFDSVKGRISKLGGMNVNLSFVSSLASCLLSLTVIPIYCRLFGLTSSKGPPLLTHRQAPIDAHYPDAMNGAGVFWSF